MEFFAPFATPLASFDVKEFLPHMRNQFDSVVDMENVTQGANFHTTLMGYGAKDNGTYSLDASDLSESLKNTIENAAFAFAKELGFAAEKYKPEMVNFWFNGMKSGMAHPLHSHYGYHFSGCVYIDMPKDASGISFFSPRNRFDIAPLDVTHYSQCNAPSWSASPKEGQAFIWESWLQHEVLPSQFDGIRKSAAFDVLMKRISF